jgi:hypothetical protein
MKSMRAFFKVRGSKFKAQSLAPQERGGLFRFAVGKHAQGCIDLSSPYNQTVMKALLVLILAAAIGYVSYEYAYPPIAEAMKFTKHVPKVEPKKEVAVVEAPKPKMEEPKFKMPDDFAFLGLGKKAESWNLMLATDKLPLTALFTEAGKAVLKAGDDVITAKGGAPLSVSQAMEIPAGVKISGVGFDGEKSEDAKSSLGACLSFEITREGAKSTLFVEAVELEATMKKEPFTFAGAGVTYLELDNDSKIIKREIKGAATLTEILSTEAHPPASAPKGWMWMPESFACYRGGKLIGFWDVLKGDFRAATADDAPESFDFDGLRDATIKAIADTMPKEAPKMAAAPEPPPQDPTGFVPPVFPPVEQVTQNWTVIPAGFFAQPKQVTMKKDLELTLSSGGATAKSSVKAGGKITITGQKGANLIVGNPGSPMRGEVPMEDTDLKEVFTAAYEQIKILRTEQARKAHEYQLAAAERAKNNPGMAKGAAGGAGGVGGKPEKDAEGKYPILLASMRAGDVTEIKPDNVKSWGEPQQEKIDDKDYWTINVKYETQTMFGKFETEAQARIRNNKVEKWVYTGSGEVVP